MTQALQKEKLPTSPTSMKSAVSRELRKDPKYKSAKEAVDIRKSQVAGARERLRAAKENLSGKSGKARTEALKGFDRAQRDLNKRGTELNKAQTRVDKQRASTQKRIEARVARVAARASKQARDRQAKTGRNIMGVDERVGDQPIKP